MLFGYMEAYFGLLPQTLSFDHPDEFLPKGCLAKAWTRMGSRFPMFLCSFPRGSQNLQAPKRSAIPKQEVEKESHNQKRHEHSMAP